MGKIFWVEFQRVPLKSLTKLSYPYIERCNFYTTLQFEELLDSRARKRFWKGPPAGQLAHSISTVIEHVTLVAITVTTIFVPYL